MTQHLIPDLTARIRLLPAEISGRTSHLPAAQFGCPLIFQGEGFDCRVLLDRVGRSVAPGETVDVPIKFLSPDLVKPRLRSGDEFTLWEGGVFAEGEVLQVLD